MRSAIAALAPGLVLVLLQGCGQTGPLYLPAEGAVPPASDTTTGDPAVDPIAIDTDADDNDGVSVPPATDTE